MVFPAQKRIKTTTDQVVTRATRLQETKDALGDGGIHRLT